MSLRSMLVLGLPLTLVAAAPFGYSLTMPPPPAKKVATAAKPVDKRKAAEKLCASRSVNDRLKARIFAEAAVAGEGPSSNLDLLSSFSEVRMDQPLLKDHDEELGITVCTGRFVLLLPPGSEQRFGGRTLLQADVEYAAQPAADGSGLVYQLRGADSIVYRLAAYTLRPDEALRQRAAELAAARAAANSRPLLPEAFIPADILSAVPQAASAPETMLAERETPALAKPIRLAAVEEKPQKPKPVQAKEPAKLAGAEPKKTAKPTEKEARVAARADKKEPKSAKPEQVRPSETGKPTIRKASKTQLASVEPKAKPATPAKPKPAEPAKPTERLAATAGKPVAPEKPKQQLAASRKKPATSDKPKQQLAKVQKPAVSEKPKPQLAAARKTPAALEKPTQLAAAAKKAPTPQPVTGGTTNTFLAYEQRKAAAPVPASEPAPAPRPAPVRVTAAADRCASAGGTVARLVCANPGLRAKQRSVDSSYFAALEDAEGEARRRLTSSRSRFAAYLDRCSTAACLANAYDDRLAEIRDIMAYY